MAQRLPGKHGPSGLSEVTDKITFLKDLGVDRWTLDAIPNARLRAYGQAVVHRPPSETKRLKHETQSVEVICFLRMILLELTDVALLNHEQAEAARASAEAANQVKSEFLANMSHEIRTPLNGVIGFAQLALMTTDNPEQRRYMTNIQLASNQLLRLINDILDMSKIEAGKLDLEHIQFELSAVIRSVATQISPRLNDKGLKLVIDTPPRGQHPDLGRSIAG